MLGAPLHLAAHDVEAPLQQAPGVGEVDLLLLCLAAQAPDLRHRLRRRGLQEGGLEERVDGRTPRAGRLRTHDVSSLALVAGVRRTALVVPSSFTRLPPSA